MKHTPSFDVHTTIENRFITRQGSFGQIDLIYLQSFVDLVRMTDNFPPFTADSVHSRCDPGHCKLNRSTVRFEGNVSATLQSILPMLGITHAFVSAGWNDNIDYLSELSCTLKDFSDTHPDVKLYLITRPATLENPANVFDEKKLKCKVHTLNRSKMKNVPKSWYWDNLHVRSIMNEEFNHQLIEAICPL
ncbi:hypothetical protein N9D08_00885 [bacterium]|nr:hypothetical protein [bacterium]